MNEAKKLIQQITEGIQDKKGKKIVIADLTRIDDTICNYFVICQGNSPSQVSAIVESVKDFTRKGANSKPFAIDGLRNAEWVAMDYSDVLVHVFQPEAREFYNLAVTLPTLRRQKHPRRICQSTTSWPVTKSRLIWKKFARSHVMPSNLMDALPWCIALTDFWISSTPCASTI